MRYEVSRYTRVQGGTVVSGLTRDQVLRRRHLLTPLQGSPDTFLVHDRGAGFFPGEQLEIRDASLEVRQGLRPLLAAGAAGADSATRAPRKAKKSTRKHAPEPQETGDG